MSNRPKIAEPEHRDVIKLIRSSHEGMQIRGNTLQQFLHAGVPVPF